MTGARFQQQLWGEMVRPWPCFVFRLPACCPCPPSPIMVILLILTTQCLSILNRKWFEKSNCVFLYSDLILLLIECSDQEASSPVSSSSCGPVIECSQQWLWKEAGWWKKAGSKTSNDGSWAELSWGCSETNTIDPRVCVWAGATPSPGWHWTYQPWQGLDYWGSATSFYTFKNN